MEKINVKAIYGIAVEKSQCSSYVLQQKLLKKLRQQSETLIEKYLAQWVDAWGRIEDRILSMEEEELIYSWEYCKTNGILEFEKEMQNIVNRNRYLSYKTYR